MNDVYNRARRIIGISDNSEKRKRRGDTIELHQFAKYRRVSDEFPKYITQDVYKPTKSHFAKLEQKIRSRFLSSSFLRFTKPKTSQMNGNGNAYVENEFSDDEDEVIIVRERPILNSTTNSNKQYVLGDSSTFKSPTLTSSQHFKPFARGSMMLNRVLPGLHPIDKTSFFPVNNFGGPLNMAKNVGFNKPRPHSLLLKNNTSFLPKKEIIPNRNFNSILSEAYNLDQKRNYHELLKKVAPNLYKTKEYNKDDASYNMNGTSSGTQTKIHSVVDLITDDEEESSNNKEKNILPEVIVISDVEPVNTLNNKFSLKPEYCATWLPNSTQKYIDRDIERRKNIEEQKERLIELQLNSRKNELEISKSLQEFVISDVICIESESESEEIEFPEISKKEKEYVRNITVGAAHDVIITKFNLRITRRDLCTLVGDSWLNDEVINFYMNLLMERSEIKQDSGALKVYAMNTFFIPKILQSGHAGVKRWTRKVDIFSYDIIPVPVHVGQVHWCMAIIHLRNKSIKYYDSMGQANSRVLSALEMYLKDESLDKKKVELNLSSWNIESVKKVPRQMNGSDCGVFSCMFAEYATRNKDITFSQDHMQYFRTKMILEIATGKLLL